MQQFDSALTDQIAEHGPAIAATSIAPTGTISLSLANNASNGIEPSFAHLYSRNIIREGRKTKEGRRPVIRLGYRALVIQTQRRAVRGPTPCRTTSSAQMISVPANMLMFRHLHRSGSTPYLKTANVDRFPLKTSRTSTCTPTKKGSRAAPHSASTRKCSRACWSRKRI